MKEIKDFINYYIDLQLKKESAHHDADIKTHNEIVSRISTLCHPNLVMAKNIREPLSFIDQKYMASLKGIDALPRVIFKLSEYKKGDVKYWACYLSQEERKPGTALIYSQCLLATHIEGKLKFVSKYFTDYDSGHWRFGGGAENYEDFYSIGELVQIERFQEPDDERGKIHFNIDE